MSVLKNLRSLSEMQFYINAYVLRPNDLWESMNWKGLSNFYGSNIWTDGDNIYYSDNSNQYVLDKSTRTWTPKTWNGISSFSGKLIWKDGDNICLSGNKQYKHKIFKLRLKA